MSEKNTQEHVLCFFAEYGASCVQSVISLC